MPKAKKVKRIKEGFVVSDKMKKTIVVKVSNLARHRQYGRIIQRSTKFKVHDEKNQAKAGDKVRIAATRPISKEKHWRLVEVIK